MNNDYQKAVNTIRDTFNYTEEDVEQALQEALKITYIPNSKQADESIRETLNKLQQEVYSGCGVPPEMLDQDEGYSSWLSAERQIKEMSEAAMNGKLLKNSIS